MSNRLEEKSQIEGVSNRESASRFPWFRASFFVMVCFLVIVPFTSLPKDIYRALKKKGIERPENRNFTQPDDITQGSSSRTSDSSPSNNSSNASSSRAYNNSSQNPASTPSTPSTQPTSTPDQIKKNPTEHFAKSGGDVRKLSKDIDFKTHVKVENGDLASVERTKSKSYEIEYSVKVKLPRASTTIEDLKVSNPDIDTILPGLKELMKAPVVSPYYYSIYNYKVDLIKRNATNLNQIVTRHNFYDCETILNLTHPESKRKVMLMQAEMDVVSDGSDGDRLPKMPEKIVNSTYYQPTTSYGWRKVGTRVNPMIPGFKRRIANADKEINQSSTTSERSAWLKKRKKMLKAWIEDLEIRSYLVAEYDPFIVMPTNMIVDMGDKYAPKAGDYAVVIYDGVLYPCIVGDAGPNSKVGEASLRMAKQINSAAGIYSRPVSDLKVTYIVFPFSREKTKSAPNYEKWRKKCEELLGEIGGLGDGYSLYKWKNTFPPVE